jgi:hypothetical protein
VARYKDMMMKDPKVKELKIVLRTVFAPPITSKRFVKCSCNL